MKISSVTRLVRYRLARLALVIGLAGLLLALWLVAMIPARADAGIRYVAPDGDDSKLCDSIADRCRTVQRAIDVADPFDEIRVATGTYTDAAGTVAAINKTVTLLGGWNDGFTTCDPNIYPSTLDAQRNGRVVYISGNISPTIDGFVITGGNANNQGGVGGGILSSDASPVIRNNIITNNIAYMGTTPWGKGGGIYLSNASASAIISGNRVLSNTASTTYYGLGGGLCFYSSAVKVSGNEVINNTAGRGGAAIYLHDSDGVTFNGNQIVGNTAVVSPTAQSSGGGLYIEFTGPFTLTNNVIAQNYANTAGGGLYVYGSNGIWTSNGELVNNTIAQNNLGSGGEGVYLTGYSTLTLTNNIVVSHTYGIYNGGSSTATARYTLFYGNTNDTGGRGVINSTNAVIGDPLFINPAGWDYHLRAGSPCIDAGTDAGVTTDIDNDPRPMGAGVDIGADEYHRYAIYLPLVMKSYTG
ncbi:MAG: choice-of-anchor Q domain-containing protein [Anaerolineae bacterium]